MISLIPPQVKVAMYAAVVGCITVVGAYGYYLYNKVDELKLENSMLSSVVEQKEKEMLQTIEQLKSAQEELVLVQEKIKMVDSLSVQRQVQISRLNSKLKSLGDKISSSATPTEFEGDVNSEFVSVLSCVERASGKTESGCAYADAQEGVK